MRKMYELVKTFNVEPIEVKDGENLNFRIEVFNEVHSSVYFGRVYRMETFRLQPSFPQVDGVLPNWAHDGLIYVADDMFDLDKLRGSSVEDVIEAFKKLFSFQFE
jgi:hypothetical protein